MQEPDSGDARAAAPTAKSAAARGRRAEGWFLRARDRADRVARRGLDLEPVLRFSGRTGIGDGIDGAGAEPGRVSGVLGAWRNRASRPSDQFSQLRTEF